MSPSFLGYAQDMNVSSILTTGIVAKLDETNSAADSLSFSLQTEWEKDFKSGVRLTSIVKVENSFQKGTNVQIEQRSSYQKLSKPILLGRQGNLELRELYLEYDVDDVYFKLGKQQVVWGKADGLKILDVINPQSYRKFILAPFEESRIPLWLAKIEKPLSDNIDLQVLWIPDNTSHVLPNNSGDFAFTSRRFVPDLSKLPTGANVSISALQASDSLSNSDFGFRLNSFVNGWDLTLNYLYHYDDFAVLFFEPQNIDGQVEISINPELKRSHLLGGSFSNSLGNYTFRGEMGYETDKFFMSTTTFEQTHKSVLKGNVKSDVFSYVLGVDWYGLEDSLISFQLFQSHILTSGLELFRANIDTTMTLLTQTNMYNQVLKLELLMLHNLDDKDNLLRTKAIYDWSDNLKLSLAMDVFGGNEQGLFGQFKTKDRIEFLFEYSW
jgi:hypothetical protein